MRSEQDMVDPQQGHVAACGKQRDVKHDEYINEWSQSAAWPQQGGGSSGDVAFPVDKPKGAPQLLHWPSSSWHRQKHRRCPKACIRILENEVQKEEAAMKQAPP